MPAITVVGAPTSTGNAANASSRAVNVPTGSANKDVAVCILDRWFGSNTNPAVTTPSNFVQIGSAVSSGDSAAKLTAYYKRLTAGDSGQYTFSWTGAAWTILHCIMLRNVIDTGDPLADILKSVSGTYGSVPSMNLTADAGAAVIWRMYNDSAGTHTPPTGYTEPSGLDNDSASLAYFIATATGTQTASGGSVTSSSPAAAILIGFKPQPDSGSTGTLSATISSPTAAIAGTARASGSMAPSLPAPAAALAGSSASAGALAATLTTPTAALAGQGVGSALLAASVPMPLAALAASAVGAGVLVATLPEALAGLSAQSRSSAELAGALPELTAALAGAATDAGELAASLPELAAALTGVMRNLATLGASLPEAAGAFAGSVDTEEELLLVILPMPEMTVTAEATATGELSGTLPALTGGTFGTAMAEALLLDGLPEITAQFFGQVFTPGAGQLTITLPGLMAITGRARQMKEQNAQRKATRDFIMASPVEIILTPNSEERTGSGAAKMADGVPRPVQTFRLIPMSHTERPVASTTEGGGRQRRYDMTILGEWDSVMAENDWWEQDGQVYVIDAVIPFNGYERKGLVTSHGRRGSIV